MCASLIINCLQFTIDNVACYDLWPDILNSIYLCPGYNKLPARPHNLYDII